MNPQTMSLLGIAISSLCTVLVAYIQREAKKQKKVDDDRERRRRKEARLSMEMMSASIELGVINAVALQHGTLNGNVEAAKKKAEEAQQNYRNFLADIASEEI